MKKETLQKMANRIARQHGYGRATDIKVVEGLSEPKILERVDYGYRKLTTGEYVSHTYRNKFGWKNTYYQDAVTVVGIPTEMAKNL